MKNLIKVINVLIIGALFSTNLYGQSASVTWPLSSITTVTPTNSGYVTGQNESFSNMVINNYAGPNSSQRVTITGGSWPAESAQNETRYIQFAATPNSGYAFNITSITLSLGADGGSNMKANIWYSTDPTFTTRTQLNSTVLSLPNGSLSSLSYSPAVTVNDGQTFYLRIYPWYTTSATGKYVCPQNLIISGTTTSSFPEIQTSVSSLTNFLQEIGSPSSTQSYTVSGVSLTNNVVVTSPINFEISTNNGNTWHGNSSPVTLIQSGGTLVGQPVTILVRLNASSAAEYTGNITHTSTGATTRNVTLSGVTLATEPTIQSTINFGTVTHNSIVVNFSGGNGSRRVLVARATNAVSWAPADGNPVSGVNNVFTLATNQGDGNRAVYDGTGNSVTVSGLTGNTTYHFAIYEYNVETGNSQNYLTTSPGTGNRTTLSTSTIIVDPVTLYFGSVDINNTSQEKMYTISATALDPANGNIFINAPAGFEISLTSGYDFGSLLQIPYSNGFLGATTIYVRFKPTLAQTYVANVTNSGGNAETKNVMVTGTGIGALEHNVFQAEDAILISSYVLSQYSGYTGGGYVDMADRNGSAVEFTFRRSTAANDTVIIRFANGGSSRSLTISLNGTTLGTLNFASTGSWSSWSNVSTVIAFQAGINRLRFTLTTNASGPNLDKITVTGQTATPVYKLTLAKSGAGNVSAFPASADSFYDAGTQVTLTAYPNANNILHRWAGTEQSRSNPFVITMNSHKTQIGIMANADGIPALPFQTYPKGFASVGALGYPNGTTGGTGSPHVAYVNTTAELSALMYCRVDPNRTLNFPPLTVYIIGTLTGSGMIDVKDVYDISIIGVGVDATLSGCGLNITRSYNIIVRNILFQNATADGINIDADGDPQKGHHIWIDHCSFTNGYDGAIDITHAAAYVTVSWCHFYNFDKTSLVGNSDTTPYDTLLKVTYHHNYFDGSVQRHPRVRFGKVHVFNNYYRNITSYGVSSNREAEVMVEGNYFLNVPIPYESLRVGTIYPGKLVARNNILAGTTGQGSTRGTVFEPSSFYSYTLDDPAIISDLVPRYAGRGKYDFSGEGEGILPIQLASFIGNFIAINTVKLEWETISEINNYGFYVEKYNSVLQRFETIESSFQPGAGHSLEPRYYSWIDENATGTNLQYRLKQIDNDGLVNYFGPIMLNPTSIKEEQIPAVFMLAQNYPNPFNPSTEIRFSVDKTGNANLTVYNLLGQKVTTLFDGIAEAGKDYTLQFNADNLPSGVYFYQLKSGDNISVKKLLLLK